MGHERSLVRRGIRSWPLSRGLAIVWALFLVVALTAPVSAQQGEASVFVARGMVAYEQQRYDDALADFRQALQFDANNVDALYYTGLTNIALKQYDQAVRALEQAKRLAPRDESITFQLGALYFGLEQYDRAQPLLEEVFAINPRLDNLGYYVGFMRYRKQNYQGAIRAFRAGASTDPNLLQLTRLYSGLALAILGLPEQATAELDEALKIQPSSPLIGPADRLRGAVVAAREKQRRFTGEVRLGFFYDDNVPVIPGVGKDPATSATSNQQKASSGELASVRFDYSFFRQGGFDVTGTALFFTTYNNDLTNFNILNSLGGLGSSYRGLVGGTPYIAGLQYTYDYVALGGSKFVQRHTVVPSVVLLPNSWNLDALQFRFQNKGYGQEQNTPGPEKRDGSNYMGGWTHAFRFANDQHQIRIGYQWDWDDLAGPNKRGWDYSYYGNRVLVGGQYTLPWYGIRLTDDFDFHLREYVHTNLFFPTQAPNTVRRRDFEFTNVVAVVVPLPHSLSFTVSWQGTINNSNLDFYQYRRNVVSAIMGWTF